MGNTFSGLINRKREERESKNQEAKQMFETKDLLDDINHTKKKHSIHSMFSKRDSQEYRDVQVASTIAAQHTTSSFGKDIAKNEKMITDTMGAYYKLLSACSAYIEKGGGKTESGKARKDKVRQMQAQAKQDLESIEQAFFAIKSMNAEEQSQLTWDDILHAARAGEIETGALTEGGRGATKSVSMIDEGVFVPEKKTNLLERTDFIDASFSSINLHKTSKAVKSENKKEKAKASKKLNEKEINMTNRNVAMSKVANLFGMGEVIEQSKSVTIKEKTADGEKVQKGNLMSKARGEMARTAAINSYARENEDGKKMNEIEKMKDREEIVKKSIDPNLQKQLSSLQVLDYICAQGDRHMANYFVEQNSEGKFSSVHGIDNDMSFSDGVDFETVIRSGFGKENFKGINIIKTRMVVDSKDNLVIPHMDQQLAMNILNTKENEFRDILVGLIEPEFIEAAVLRFKKVQNAIKKEFGKKDSKVFVKDGEWNEDTHNDFMEAGQVNKLVKIWKEKKNEKKIAQGKEANTTDEEVFYELGIGDLTNLNEKERYEEIYSNSYYADFVARFMGFNVDKMMWLDSNMKYKKPKNTNSN